MPDYEELLQKLLPAISKEAAPAEAGVNKAALDTLKSGRAADTDAVLQGSEANADKPLTQKMDLSGVDTSKLPETNERGFQLVGSPQDKNFTLGPSSDISRPPVPYKGADPEVEKNLPVASKSERPDLSGDTIDVTPVDPWEARKAKLKSLAVPAAAVGAVGAAGVLASRNGGSGDNSAKAAEPAAPSPKAPVKVAPAAQDDEDEDEGDDETPVASKAPVKAAPTAASYLSRVTPQAPQLPANDPNTFSNQRLAELQDRSNKMQALNNLARGMTAAVATAGQQRTNNFDPLFEAQGKQFAAMPDQYVQRAAMQKMDPNSPASIASRNLAQYIDPDMKVTPDMSAADLEKILPQMANIETNEEATQARIQTAKMHNDAMMIYRQQRADAAKEAADAKQDKSDNDRMNTWAKSLSLPTSRSTLGQAKAQLFSVDRVQALLNGHPTSDINPQEAAEVYRGLDRVISGGSPTVQGSKSLDPDTAMAGIAKLMQQYTNQSQSAHAQNFLDRTNHNLENEKEAARRTVLDISHQFLAGGRDLYDRKPDQVRKFLSDSGLPTDMFDDKAAALTKQNTGDDTGSSNRSYVKPAIRQAAQSQAAAIVGRDTKAQADTSQAAQAPAASGQSLQDAATAEMARRKAARAQAGGQ